LFVKFFRSSKDLLPKQLSFFCNLKLKKVIAFYGILKERYKPLTFIFDNVSLMGTLYQGAKNAVEVCMAVKPGEHILIVTDKCTYAVGNTLKHATEEITPVWKCSFLKIMGKDH